MASNIFLDLFKSAPAFVRETNSEDQTQEVALALGRQLVPGDWVALVGDLSAGKTSFVQGMGEALHCREVPRSPTFNLVQVYKPKPGAGKLLLKHVDLYRLSPKDVPSLEWEELLSKDGVTVVEWAEKAQGLWPRHCLPVHITHQGENRRLLGFYAYGERSEQLIQKLKQVLGKPKK
ncbi:MAG: tRNA (adenosine(37)-N6)-threonylcarbamoyltransferase complex ATPase subunit type 1 TsaE [Elusimicrobia bacterium]|nr:tRNA (adenosine(37)-N6)-threonylcarbamoyltransferase complex ATPase subunit type 1 TsaE [Elusimicrobiota bacterium]